MILLIIIYVLSAVAWWYFVHKEGGNGSWDTSAFDIIVMFIPVINTIVAIIFNLIRVIYLINDSYNSETFKKKFFNY